MCLTNLLSKEKREELLKSLPESFDCFRIVKENGNSLYEGGSEESCVRPGNYNAKNYPGNRSSLSYKPGFHVFNIETSAIDFQAQRYWSTYRLKIQKIRVNKNDIIEVGQINNWSHSQVFVSKEITVK